MNDIDYVLGFADESAQRISARTARVWSEGKPIRKVNSDRVNANIFGFYAINGNSTCHFSESSKGPDMCDFLEVVRAANGSRKVVMILDNGPIHHTNIVKERAEALDITLVFLPPFSPQYNPIELIWKTIKSRISGMFLLHKDHLIASVKEIFMHESGKDSYSQAWRRDFLIDHDSKKLGS